MVEFVDHVLDTALSGDDRGAVIAIGNFDGVHRGHQAVLQSALDLAALNRKQCFVLSFEPHPRTLFKPQSPVFRLTPKAVKARVLRATGLNGLLTLPFTRGLASTSADDFVDQFLVDAVGAHHVISGFNFHFGKDRIGSPQFLQQAGAKRGFGVTIVEARTDQSSNPSAESPEPISSSRIRRLLGAGNAGEAASLLGYRWMACGTVIKGAQIGRTLGYPTANLSLPESCHLAHGIYAVRLRRADGSLHNGVASFGRRPTFDNGEALLETFVFDFNESLYGEAIEISLFAFLRGEEKFDSAEALIAQMDKDQQQARDILSAAKPLSKLDQILTFDGLASAGGKRNGKG